MRNFGIPKVTTRATSGEQPSRGPHTSADTRADNVIIFGGDRVAPVVQRGGRFSESQSAGLSPFREGGLTHSRSRLASHAPIQFADRHPSRIDRPNSQGSNPALFIPISALERGKVAQALIDILAFLAWGLLLSLLGACIFIAPFLIAFPVREF